MLDGSVRPAPLVVAFLVAIVRLYQRTLSRGIRLFLGNVCRFEPSCSNYAVACLQEHGALRGSLLSIARVCKCHPFHPGGHDPPPPRSPGAARMRSRRDKAACALPGVSLPANRERAVLPPTLPLTFGEHPRRSAG